MAQQVPMTVRGIALERESHLPILLLQTMSDSAVLPIPIGPAEASSIIVEIEGVLPPRPLTHDLITEVFNRHHFHALYLELYGQSLGKHLARLVYAKGLRRRSLELRPSDGVALALRLCVPIFADSSIVEKSAAAISSYDDFTPDSSEILYLSGV